MTELQRKSPAEMSAMEAIQMRISCRSYTDRVMEDCFARELQSVLDEANAMPELRFQLCGPYSDGRPAVHMSEKMFSGPVYCCAALLALDTEEAGDKVGYFGEKLVLRATQLGFGTCWVASTYDRGTLALDVRENERLWDIIPIGYPTEKTPLKQRTIRASLRRFDKKPEKLIDADMPFDELPQWIRRGIDAVVLGPSAVNGQPVVFSYRDGVVSADLPRQKRDVEFNDLGIAKLHFQLAAREAGVKGVWEWGRKGRFLTRA